MHGLRIVRLRLLFAPKQERRRHQDRRQRQLNAALEAVSGLAGGLRQPHQQSQTPVDTGLLSSYEQALEDIYNRVSPPVVNIRVVQKQEITSNDLQQFPGFPFFGLPDNSGPQYSQGLGSGFVWDQEGHIVTNNHVIVGANKVEVTFSDGSSVSAKVIGTDVNSDLAVIQVDAPSAELHPVQMADSTQVKVGQMAIAIGDPFGLQGTMTVGIVSALGRTLPSSQG